MASVAAINRPVKASAGLAKIIGADVTTRGEAIKGVWNYIKKNNLQDATVKTQINSDSLFKEVFKVDNFKSTAIMGLVAKNVEKVAEQKMQ